MPTNYSSSMRTSDKLGVWIVVIGLHVGIAWFVLFAVEVLPSQKFGFANTSAIQVSFISSSESMGGGQESSQSNQGMMAAAQSVVQPIETMQKPATKPKETVKESARESIKQAPKMPVDTPSKKIITSTSDAPTYTVRSADLADEVKSKEMNKESSDIAKNTDTKQVQTKQMDGKSADGSQQNNETTQKPAPTSGGGVKGGGQGQQEGGKGQGQGGVGQGKGNGNGQGQGQGQGSGQGKGSGQGQGNGQGNGRGSGEGGQGGGGSVRVNASQVSGSIRLSYSDRDLQQQDRSITMHIAINAKGKATSVTVIKSTGLEYLDNMVVRAVRATKFNPHVVNGVAVPIEVNYPVHLKMSKR